MNKEQGSQKGLAEVEIDLISLTKKIWKSRKLILKITVLFFITGLIVAFLSRQEFTSSSTFVPQTDTAGSSGNLGGLASLAGINLGGMMGSSEIPPSLYPKIINSVKFKRTLLQVPITIEEQNITTTYQDYYEDIYVPGVLSSLRKYTIGLPGIILNPEPDSANLSPADKNEDNSSLIRISKEEVKHFERLGKQLQIISDDKEGTVELRFNMPEPLMAAQMAKAAEETLQREVIAYKIQNAREQLKYTEEQFEEKRTSFLQKQKELAKFRDRNQHISSAVAMNKLQSLEAEYNFAFNIYTEIAKQLEQTKLQVSKDTPVFSIINPVSVPIEKSAPNRVLIVIIFTTLGIIAALGWIFFIGFFSSFKENWSQEKHINS